MNAITRTTRACTIETLNENLEDQSGINREQEP